ncbi:MAG: DUF1285 domain-containing protein [Pseudomonadota bacterium]
MTPEDLLSKLQTKLGEQYIGRPPVDSWHPERRGNIDIVIDETGAWWHDGTAFARQSLVELFAKILRREGDDYFLVTPVEALQITVKDVPFIATELVVEGSGADTDLYFTTNVGDVVLADLDHPLSMRAAKPYLHVRAGLEARLSTSVYYQLAEYVQGDLEDDVDTYVVHSQGHPFKLASGI